MPPESRGWQWHAVAKVDRAFALAVEIGRARRQQAALTRHGGEAAHLVVGVGARHHLDGLATRGGETFTLHPGEVLVAEDNTGTGHRWHMVDDQPWRRGYVVLKQGAPDSFIPNDPVAAKACKPL